MIFHGTLRISGYSNGSNRAIISSAGSRHETVRQRLPILIHDIELHLGARSFSVQNPIGHSQCAYCHNKHHQSRENPLALHRHLLSRTAPPSSNHHTRSVHATYIARTPNAAHQAGTAAYSCSALAGVSPGTKASKMKRSKYGRQALSSCSLRTVHATVCAPMRRAKASALLLPLR